MNLKFFISKNKKSLVLSIIFIFFIILILFFGIKYYASKNSDRYCFYNHIDEAIQINSERKNYYSQVTEGRSAEVSDKLINKEKGIILWALLVDLRAQKFIKQGIPVVCGDFTSMKNIISAEEKPIYSRVANERAVFELKEMLKLNRGEFLENIKNEDFMNAAEGLYNFLLEIEDIEKETKSNFCMTKHVLESAGLAALHANQYDITSKQGARNFLKFFLEIKGEGLDNFSIDLDHMAQGIHASGVAIVCNDLPSIPFKEEWESKY